MSESPTRRAFFAGASTGVFSRASEEYESAHSSSRYPARSLEGGIAARVLATRESPGGRFPDRR